MTAKLAYATRMLANIGAREPHKVVAVHVASFTLLVDGVRIEAHAGDHAEHELVVECLNRLRTECREVWLTLYKASDIVLRQLGFATSIVRLGNEATTIH